jgi:hypothetical protein
MNIFNDFDLDSLLSGRVYHRVKWSYDYRYSEYSKQLEDHGYYIHKGMVKRDVVYLAYYQYKDRNLEFLGKFFDFYRADSTCRDHWRRVAGLTDNMARKLWLSDER